MPLAADDVASFQRATQLLILLLRVVQALLTGQRARSVRTKQQGHVGDLGRGVEPVGLRRVAVHRSHARRLLMGKQAN